MNNKNNITIEQIIDTLSAIIAPNNHVMDAIPASQQELLQKSALISLSIIKTSEMVSNSGGQIDHNELYNKLSPLLTDPAVIESYNRWKDDLYSMTPNMLKRKRMQVILDVLKRGIMKHDDKPYNDEFDNIREDNIKPLISCEEKLSDDIKKELAKLKRYLIIDGDIIMIDRQKFGKYAMKHIKEFSYEDARSLFELDAILDFVNTDLTAINPKLQAIINKHRPQPKPQNDFAPGFITKRILKHAEVLKLVTDRQKYTAEWLDKFVDDLMASEYRQGIIEGWENCKKRDKIPAHIAGTLVKAGVFGCSNAELARAIRKGHNYRVKTDCYATYMGQKKEQPYLDWVRDYVECFTKPAVCAPTPG